MHELILKRTLHPSATEPLSDILDAEFKIQPPSVIGRGPTLKCADKRVSRNQATIDWDDDGILITSTHLNPIYVKVGGKEGVLHQNESLVLNIGDEFGLLKQEFWFKIYLSSRLPNEQGKGFVSEDESKNGVEVEVKKLQQDSPSKSKNDVSQSKPFVDVNSSDNKFLLPHSPNASTSFQKKNVEENKCEENIIKSMTEEYSVPSMSGVGSVCATRKRKLPSWLLESSPKGRQDVDLDLDLKKAKLKNASKPHGGGGGTVKVGASRPKNKKKPSLLHSDDSFPVEEDRPPKKENINEIQDQITTENDHDSERKQTLTKKTRKMCKYGEQCYRANPEHKRDVAHPGDDDYKRKDGDGDSDDDDDERPECEYGISCYRKNRQHKTDFKHTKKLLPPRRAKRRGFQKRDKDSDESTSEDDFDFEDSEDDYAPSE